MGPSLLYLIIGGQQIFMADDYRIDSWNKEVKKSRKRLHRAIQITKHD